MKKAIWMIGLLCGLAAGVWGQAPMALTTDAEYALVAQRMNNGPYKAAGDAGVNSPADAATILAWANAFKASPADTGNFCDPINPNNPLVLQQDIWTGTGYKVKPGTVNQYPQGQMCQGEAAGMMYRVTGDTSYGMPLVRTLVLQALWTRADVSLWGSNPLQPAPVYDVYAQVGVWLARLNHATFHVYPLMSGQQRVLVDGFCERAATAMALAQNARLAVYLPARSQGNTSVRLSYFSTAGATIQGRYAIFPKAGDAYQRVVDGEFSYTGIAEDGKPEWRVPFTAQTYNNRDYMITLGYGLTGMRLGNATLTGLAVQYLREGLIFGTWPNGAFGEEERNGRIYTSGKGSDPGFGRYKYGWINLQAYISLADVMLKNGDSSLYAYKTTDGQHGTQVPNGGRAKSLAVVLERMVDGILNEGAQTYYGTKSSANRVSNVYLGDMRTINGRAYGYESQFDYLLAVANRYYKRPRWKRAYQRDRGLNSATAGVLNYAWGGAVAERAYSMILFADRETETTTSSTASLLYVAVQNPPGTDVATMTTGYTINTGYLNAGGVALRAVMSSGTGPGSIEYRISPSPTGGMQTVVANASPYAYPGNGSAWYPEPGVYNLTVRVWSGADKSGTVTKTVTIPFSVRAGVR